MVTEKLLIFDRDIEKEISEAYDDGCEQTEKVLQREIGDLQDDIYDLERENTKLREELEELKYKMKELER